MRLNRCVTSSRHSCAEHQSLMNLANQPTDFLLDRLIYRDGLMLVIDKPRGMRVHDQAGGKHRDDKALDQYFDCLRFGLPRQPSLAHRLDRDTSGCLILGRHPKALRKLSKLFQAQKIEKTYLAITNGTPLEMSGFVTHALERDPSSKTSKMQIAKDGAGQVAQTAYEVLALAQDHALVKLSPKTGRMHQLRVHLQSIGTPIIGDWLYGKPAHNQPMMLHARAVTVPISKNKPPVLVEAPVPEDMRAPFAELFLAAAI